MDWSYCAFEVYTEENICPVVTLAEVVTTLSKTQYQGYISPLHKPDTLNEHQESGKGHYHICLSLLGRYTVKSVQCTLDSCGVKYANRYLLRLAGRKDYEQYCRYLLHRTSRSSHKQQWSKDTLAFPINLSLNSYSRIFQNDYQRQVMQLITEQNINSPVQLLDMVSICLEEYYSDVWRDINKWAVFFSADRIKTAYN